MKNEGYFFWDSRYLLVEDETINKINSFKHLEAGWDFGIGEPAVKLAADLAIQIYKIGVTYQFKGDAFPDPNGGVVLSLYIEDHFLYITINSNCILDLRYEKGIGQEYDILLSKENVSLSDIIDTLKLIQSKCFSLGLYISGNMTQKADDSLVTAFGITGLAYHASMKNAHMLNQGQCVTTSPNFTTRQLETQSYSLELIPMY